MQVLRPLPCKICGAAAPLYGTVDFNRHCQVGNVAFPAADIPIHYHRCSACGFLFTTALDGWPIDHFKNLIYNADYIRVDPDYAQARPAGNAAFLIRLLGPAKGSLTVLDYGGGSGLLADILAKNGFPCAETYDPLNPRFAELPEKQFHIVCSFETLEHVPDPRREIARMSGRVADDGVVIFSTLVQPKDFDRIGLSWWYLAPRNGHISLFSREALAIAWGQRGFHLRSATDNLHIAYRNMPSFIETPSVFR